MTAVAQFRTRIRPFPDLDRPAQVFAHFTPNWFATVMGTGIVAVATGSLPYQPRGLRTGAVGVWALAVALLAAVTVATVVHWVRHPRTARGHLDHPVMASFHGAVPMAVLTVGAGTLLVGRDVVGGTAALGVDAVLWVVGTAGGLVTAFVVPRRLAAAGTTRPEDAFGGWLMPVVPPMVSASTGALLVPHAPAGAIRLALLVACYALFAGAAVASARVVARVVRRVLAHGVGPTALVPTLWIVLGPLGQSVTAAGLLGGVAHEALPAEGARALQAFGFAYGVPVWTAALGWAVFAAVVTVRHAPPFALTWWSFTFPVGTVVTGTSALARHTGGPGFAVPATILYAALVLTWLTVLTRTARAARRGWVFLPPGR